MSGAMHIDDIAFILWHDCIRPAARYDQWVPAPQHADNDGYTEVVTTPVLDVAGHRCTLSYWRGDLDTEGWSVAIEPDAGALVRVEGFPGEPSPNSVARVYLFGNAWPEHQKVADISYSWDAHNEALYDTPRPAILACPVYLPEQLEMTF